MIRKITLNHIWFNFNRGEWRKAAKSRGTKCNATVFSGKMLQETSFIFYSTPERVIFTWFRFSPYFGLKLVPASVFPCECVSQFAKTLKYDFSATMRCGGLYAANTPIRAFIYKIFTVELKLQNLWRLLNLFQEPSLNNL